MPANGVTDRLGNATTVQFLSTFTTGDETGAFNCSIGVGSASANSSKAGHTPGDGNDGDCETRWTVSDDSGTAIVSGRLGQLAGIFRCSDEFRV